MDMEKDIQMKIKELMVESGASYQGIADVIGCSFQNVWSKLNNRPDPTFASLRRILNAFGYDFDFEPEAPGATDHLNREAMFDGAMEETATYLAIEKTLAAVDIRIVIAEKKS